MPDGLARYQHTRNLHHISFSCYHHQPLLSSPHARDLVVRTLERVRRWYGFYINAYVVMPDHVHLLISEPERGELSVAIQMLKQIVSRELHSGGPPLSQGSGATERQGGTPLWQRRYYDFNVWSNEKFTEKLRYIHENPVRSGLAEKPEDWPWSSFAHWSSGAESEVEIESQWTARKREWAGTEPRIVMKRA